MHLQACEPHQRGHGQPHRQPCVWPRREQAPTRTLPPSCTLAGRQRGMLPWHTPAMAAVCTGALHCAGGCSVISVSRYDAPVWAEAGHVLGLAAWCGARPAAAGGPALPNSQRVGSQPESDAGMQDQVCVAAAALPLWWYLRECGRNCLWRSCAVVWEAGVWASQSVYARLSSCIA